MNTLMPEKPVTQTRPVIRKIVAAVDLTSRSFATAEYAVNVARSFGASLVFVYVHPSESMYNFISNGGYDLIDSKQRNQRHALARLAERFSKTHPFCTHAFLVGDPAEQIATFAQEMDADLIIVASHHPSFLASVLHLDQAPKIMHLAPCPVLAFQE